jgi:hypothetical protein
MHQLLHFLVSTCELWQVIVAIRSESCSRYDHLEYIVLEYEAPKYSPPTHVLSRSNPPANFPLYTSSSRRLPNGTPPTTITHHITQTFATTHTTHPLTFNNVRSNSPHHSSLPRAILPPNRPHPRQSPPVARRAGDYRRRRPDQRFLEPRMFVCCSHPSKPCLLFAKNERYPRRDGFFSFD